ncbi:TolC family protein [Thermodesulfobacteriota bacterium]
MSRFKKRSVFILVLAVITLPLSCVFTGYEKKAEDTTLSTYQDDMGVILPEEPAIEKDRRASISISGPLRISLNDAILSTMENNPSLVVERFNPSIQKTYTDEEQAVFDPVLSGEVFVERNDTARPDSTNDDTQDTTTDVYEGSISLKEYFPTGTFVELEISSSVTDADQYDDPYARSRLGLSITQSLLRGYGTEVNMARIQQSRLETAISIYELRGFSETLVAQVENAYWDYALSQRQIEIVEESLKLANQQLVETEEMIRVGVMAEAELAAVQAEVAAQKQGLINAKSALDSNRILLLRLLNPPGESFWNREISIVRPPALPEAELGDIEEHVAVAKRMRPEINQAKLDIQRQELEVVRTRNGMLPVMDLFINLGKTGYADSFSGAVGDLPGDNYDVLVGLNFEQPIRNRSAKAQRRRSLLKKNQAEKILENLSQLVELDVRNAYIEVNRTREQIAASAATRKFQEEKLRIETEKFRVGRSTNLLVAQAQRDLLVNRINEVNSVVNYLKALTSFYRLEGSLLERRGIVAPGREPVDDPR